MPGEFDFIQWLRSHQQPSDLVPVPAGDDLAVLNWPANDLLVVGVDQVLDGVHFDSSVHSPRQIGAKVMNRNLSDCAAMACLPAAAVVAAALPKGAGVEYAKELYLGMKAAGERFGCPIVGGDTGSWPGKLALSVTILGRSAGVRPVTRGGAMPGDFIFVTGPLGGSIRGRHMTFTPRVDEARALAKTGMVTAMIDLSDGLSRDLAHVCRESGVGATLRSDAIPVHDDAIAMRRDGHDPVDHALHDGEDYELLVCMRFDPGSAVPAALRRLGFEPILIGHVTSQPGIRLRSPDGDETPLVPKAWEHRL